VLDISNTKISREVPQQLFGLTDLSSLRIGQNHICYLSPSITKLEKLEELYLPRNDLEHLPPDIGRLKRLRVLDVSDNPDLDELPSQIGFLPLTQLNLTCTKALKSLPQVCVAGRTPNTPITTDLSCAVGDTSQGP